MIQNEKILVIIPARAGSKRIPGKNIKPFLGKPLVEYAVEQAQKLPFVDRIIVDTDSKEIADVAIKAGAEVPWLRPKELAEDKSMVIDSVLYLLEQLKEKEEYVPTHIMLLQTTSPLREVEDIEKVWEMMKNTNATTVLTVCETHPRLYHLSDNNDIFLVNGSEGQSTNMQAWKKGYLLNGCFVYLVNVESLKEEKKIITKKTKAVVCPKWRSVDLDTSEEWVLAEFLYKNKSDIKNKLNNL